MTRRLGFFLATVTLLAGALVLASPDSVAAQAPPDVIAVITSPSAGQSLFGMVTVTGSAAHPSAFASYTLEYDDLSDPAEQWFLVQERVTQQVQDGVLGAWRTNLVPDGTYQLRLRVFLTDGQIGEFTVTNLKVSNSEPTPVPTVASGPINATPVLPTPGPSPTSLVEQPPSSNPLAGDIVGLTPPASGPGAGAASEALGPEETAKRTTRINLGRVRSAFCFGVYLTVGIFAVMIVYLLVRGRLRPYTRRLVWQSHDEADRDQ